MKPEPYYRHNGIEVYHGDCLEVMPQLPSEFVDFVLTDPPYLVNYTGRWDSDRSAIVGDDDPSWLSPAFEQIWRLLRRDTFCVAFYGWPHSDLFVGTWKRIGFRMVSHVCLVKRRMGLGRYSRGKHEPAFLMAKWRPRIPKKGISDVIEWEREQHAFHPNQKPVSALIPLLQAYAPEVGLVFDPFMGSGSTLRAAKDCGMKAVGIELELQYCRRAAGRMAQEILFPIPRAKE